MSKKRRKKNFGEYNNERKLEKRKNDEMKSCLDSYVKNSIKNNKFEIIVQKIINGSERYVVFFTDACSLIKMANLGRYF